MAAPLDPFRCEAFELEAGLWSTSAVDLCRPKEAFAAFVDEKKCQADAVELVMDWMGVNQGHWLLVILKNTHMNYGYWLLDVIGLFLVIGWVMNLVICTWVLVQKHAERKMLKPLRTDIFQKWHAGCHSSCIMWAGHLSKCNN